MPTAHSRRFGPFVDASGSFVLTLSGRRFGPYLTGTLKSMPRHRLTRDYNVVTSLGFIRLRNPEGHTAVQSLSVGNLPRSPWFRCPSSGPLF